MLTGASEALTQLAPYDGCWVTLDATDKRVYLGRAEDDWRVCVGDRRPRYGTHDRESEEESWQSASRLGQTHVDSSGRRWIGKPNYPVSPFLQAVYLASQRWMGQRLGAAVESQIQDDVHRVDFHQLFAWRERLRSLDLAELEQLQHERSLAVDEFLRASDQFEVTASGLGEWLDAFIRINAFLAVAYDLYKVLDGQLEQALAYHGLPEPYYSQLRPAMSALSPETEARTAAGTMSSCSPQRETIRKSSPPSALRSPITSRFSR